MCDHITNHKRCVWIADTDATVFVGLLVTIGPAKTVRVCAGEQLLVWQLHESEKFFTVREFNGQSVVWPDVKVENTPGSYTIVPVLEDLFETSIPVTDDCNDGDHPLVVR